MSAPRRKAREGALQVLYQLSLNPGLSPELALSQYEASFSKSPPCDEFTRRLVLGVYDNLPDIDALIQKTSEHWRAERMAVVDRNILRLGVYELRYCDDIPTTVTLNEMVELAKEFGADTSSAFINGILDKIASQLDRPGKRP